MRNPEGEIITPSSHGVCGVIDSQKKLTELNEVEQRFALWLIQHTESHRPEGFFRETPSWESPYRFRLFLSSARRSYVARVVNSFRNETFLNSLKYPPREIYMGEKMRKLKDWLTSHQGDPPKP